MTDTATAVNENTTIKEVRKAFPDFEKLLLRIGYAPVTRMLMSMSKPDGLTIATVVRASGLTEIELGLLLRELNDRLIPYTPTVIKPKAKTSTAAKAASTPTKKTTKAEKPKAKAKTKTKAKVKGKTKTTTKAKAKAKTKKKASK